MSQLKNQFFRQVTLRICGSLEIERALHSAFIYIRGFIPADSMSFYIYNAGLGALKSVASTTASGYVNREIQTPLPARARRRLESGSLPQVWVMDRMKDDEIGAPVARSLKLPDCSGMVMILRLEGQELGALFLGADGPAKYNKEHVRLLAQLNEPFALALSNCLRYRELNELKERLADDNRYLHGEMRRLAGEEIIGADFGLKGVMDLIQEVAPLSSPVLLLGETGTGKEVFAGAIHRMSPRREGPFIKVNCGAIPETLMDSELFGHEKAAFTGALSLKRGRFERAQGGTIFLDEIAELSPEAQVRLLRVLQEKEIERVGGSEPIRLDIRVIAATHRDLSQMIRAGRFREDLYFRLQVFPIVIPPLRERRPDIPALVQHFMQRKSREIGWSGIPTLAPGAIDRLMAYPWPGNVRELENAVERALIVSKGEPMAFYDLEPPLRGQAGLTAGTPTEGDLALDAAMARHIRRALALTGGRVEGEKGAARLLRVNPATLRNRMRKLGVPFGRKARYSD